MVGAVEMAQQTEQDIENDDRPRVADMGEVIDGRPAHIHAHARRIERREGALLARERIVKRKLHRTTVASRAHGGKHRLGLAGRASKHLG